MILLMTYRINLKLESMLTLGQSLTWESELRSKSNRIKTESGEVGNGQDRVSVKLSRRVKVLSSTSDLMSNSMVNLISELKSTI